MNGFDTSDLDALAVDLGKVGARTTAAMFDTFKDGADDLRDRWRDNAKQTAGAHARRYPETITAKPRLGRHIEFEVSPDPRINRQAYLAAILEYGTATSPPHLDAQRAVDEVVPRLERRVESTLADLLDAL